MNFRFLILIMIPLLPVLAYSQTEQLINQTDNTGKKQGHWIRKYPNGNVMYDGYFRNDMPVGDFKRYYEDQTLKSLLVFNENGTEASATLYYQNGFAASKGKYVNQLKEGQWQFFSVLIEGMLINEENYLNNKRNGFSRKFYPDSTVAETINYRNDLIHGECLKYYPGGALHLRSNYTDGRLNGKFEAFFEDGKPEITGQYKNNLKEGEWIINKKDGSQRFRVVYTAGIPDNSDIDIYETNYIDSLEQVKPKIPDPEKTGEKW
jgi:antitoxin component YwqK of YwqJK toxin-antitoxin module